MRFPAVFLAVLLFAPSVSSADAVATAQHLAGDFIVPRYQAVAKAAHDQADAWTAFCAARNRSGVESLRKAYNDLADVWSDVEFMRIGPPAIGLRVERFNWWLDRTGATDKAMARMLETTDPSELAPDKLAGGSVAGQGLPIIERLLYPADAAAMLNGKSGVQYCMVGQAVAAGQATIADQIVHDWTAPDGALAALMANKRWRFAFADTNEAANVMMTDLVAGLEGLKDLKVAMVFHDMNNPAAPQLAEGIRGGRTLRDIERNLAGIRTGVGMLLGPATAAQKYELDMAFDDAERALKEVEKARNTKARAAASKVMVGAFTALAQQAMATLPAATGLTIGFNNLDGD
jgi:predicted lipoprotein